MEYVHWTGDDFQLLDYQPPKWASHLKYIPCKRIKLAQLPTPIQKWNIPGLPDGVHLFIKRDDLTGCSLTGSKIRKLEFLLADAVDKGCTDVITTGDVQSNHCRCTAIAGRHVGLQSHLVIKSKVKTIEDVPCTGNMLLSRMCGSHIYLCDADTPLSNVIQAKTKHVADSLRQTTGREPYIIPRGGSCIESIYDFIEGYDEMIHQGLLDNITDIVISCGSGGSTAGLAIANYLVAADKIRVHGYRINFDAEHVYNYLDTSLKTLGIMDVCGRDILYYHGEYAGPGYGEACKEQLDFMKTVSVNTGIILDTTYTGKGAYGMFQDLQKTPNLFKGRRILFIHTGGMLDAAYGTLDELNKEGDSSTNRIYV